MEFQIILYHNVPVYQKDVTVLSDVSLGVAKGEFVYLIGKTGSGKSSLLKTIYAELPVRMGTASVAGFNLLKIRRREIPSLRRKLGIVFQDFQLLTDRTVYENLYFVLRSTGWKNRAEMKARVEEVLKKVGLDGMGEKMPHQLSGGEQQRVAIARALLNNPEIILADEPTGNLDPETSRSIMRLLVDISKAGKAVLMATHNYTLLQEFPSRTLKCEDGRIVALP